MITTKLYSNKERFFSFYKNALKQGRAFTVISSIISLLLIPLTFLIALNDRYVSFNYQRLFERGIFYEVGITAIITFAFGVLAIITAVFLFSYLHTKKNTDFYHALPLKRSTIFGANLLAGITSILLPLIIVSIGTMIIQIAFYSQWITMDYFIGSFLDLLSIIVYVPVVFLFTSFIAVNVGTIFDTLALTAIVGFIPMIMFLIFGSLWQEYTYGGAFSFESVFLYSPFSFIFQRYVTSNHHTGKSDIKYSLILFLVAIVVAVILYLIGVYFYNRRKSEQAENTQNSDWIKIVAKVFIAFCGAALFFNILYNINIVVKVLTTIIGAFTFGIIADIILSRGIRNIKPNLKWFGGAAALFGVLFAFIYFDMSGFTKRMPKLDDITSVGISYRGRYATLNDSYYYFPTQESEFSLDSKESIEIVNNAHKIAIENKPPRGDYASRYGDEYYEKYDYAGYYVVYSLANGKTFERNFDVVTRQIYDELIKLEDKEDFVKTNNLIFEYDTLARPQEDIISRIEISDEFEANRVVLNLSKTETKDLLTALKTDMLINDKDAIKEKGQSVVAHLEISYNAIQLEALLDRQGYYGYGEEKNTIFVTEKFADTIKFLNDKGYLKTLEDTKLEYDCVKLSPFYSLEYRGNHIFAYSSNVGYGRSYERKAFASDSKSDMDTILKEAKNLMYITTEQEISNDIMLVELYNGSEPVGTKIVSKQSLPDSMIKEIDKNLGVSETEEYYVFEEALAQEYMVAEDYIG